MRNLQLTIAEPRQWETYYSSSGDEDMVFCPTEAPAGVGELVRVKLVFRDGPQFFLSGVVVWRRPPGQGVRRLRPGVGVRIHRSERTKIGYIRGYARGGLLDHRGAPRLPVRLRVTYRTEKARRMNFTRNITESGVLLSAAEMLAEGTSVELSMVAPLDLPPVKLRGTVVRHVEDEAGRAMGISLDFHTDEDKQRFALLVRDIERAFHQGRLAEEFVAK